MSILTREQRVLLEVVSRNAVQLGVRTFLVGGVVRDLLIGYSIQDKDLDIIVEGSAAALANACQKELGGSLKTFDRFFTAKLLTPNAIPSVVEVDFASTRVETYAHPGALPSVKPAALIDDDLRRRDFTVNAIALPIPELRSVLAHADLEASASIPSLATIRSLILDPYAGAQDLDRRHIRTLHEQSFCDDPTRMFRASRYVARLEGQLEPDTLTHMQRALRSGALGAVSVFRVSSELKKIASEVRWLSACEALRAWGVWDELVGERPVLLLKALEQWRRLSSPGSGAESLQELLPARIPDDALHQALLVLCSPSHEERRARWWSGTQLPKQARRNLSRVSDILVSGESIDMPPGHTQGLEGVERSVSYFLLSLGVSENDAHIQILLRELSAAIGTRDQQNGCGANTGEE